MIIPHLYPAQWILFSSADTNIGVGNIIPIQVKDINEWLVDSGPDLNGDGNYISYTHENGQYEMDYFDYYILPLGISHNEENQTELYELTQEYLTLSLNK